MMQQDNLKICENCSKPFPQQKIDLHEAYCRRNIKRCSLCFQMYDINDRQSHDKQFHSKKQCRYCQVSFSQNQLDSHQPGCKKRPVRCQFCENDIAYEQVLKHEQVCGSRTSKCQTCRIYIPLRQFDIHQIGCKEVILPIRNQHPPRVPLRDQLRQNIRDHLFGIERNQVEQYWSRRPQTNNRRENNLREHLPSYEDPVRRNEVISNQRVNVVSNQKSKNKRIQKHGIVIPQKIKASHMIQPQKIREMVDPVPISIRLAMGKLNRKGPLQNRN